MADIGTQQFPRTKRFDMEERKTMVFNAKDRTIGVDKDALAGQAADKAAAKADNVQFDRYHDKLANFFDQKLVMLEQERREINAHLNRNLVDFRKEYQKKEARREYDLSDPASLKTSLPARVGDEDGRNSVSGAQKFEGEDLLAGERRKVQLAQQAAWCAIQTAEKSALKEHDRAAEAAYAELVTQQTEYQHAIAAAQKEARSELQRAIAAENAWLADEKRAREAYEKSSVAAANLAEEANVASSDMLNENPSLAINYMAPHTRVRADHWKGMSQDEIYGIAETQAVQREELKARKLAEKEADNRYVTSAENVRRTLEMKALQVEEFKQEQRAAVFNTIKAQRSEKAARDVTMKGTFGSNTITPEFFSQFGTSAR
eukprot:CAMPEP_0197591312 /NCGR_PEP_ID=MMETSP1326-20131121/13001_1 /TAXON_ID=1155430 /ORGANISM="Genus nov. species nov., Strain RCC2288" /LENGTH=374 /DNA_ID=CAMNT_0043156713 /DNA_START=39 /DNA_END=1163 /DNA_ORIENTATION=+